MNRLKLEKDTSENKSFEKGQVWINTIRKGRIRKRTILTSSHLKMTNLKMENLKLLKKDNSEKYKSGKQKPTTSGNKQDHLKILSGKSKDFHKMLGYESKCQTYMCGQVSTIHRKAARTQIAGFWYTKTRKRDTMCFD